MNETLDLPLGELPGVLRLFLPGADPVREGGTYDYRIEGADPAVDETFVIESIEPSELFDRRAEGWSLGAFRPREHVGEVRIEVRTTDGRVGEASVDVAPWKLDHDTEYRAMLDQIADHAAEAVLRGFAPAHLRLGVDPSQQAQTTYRSFAFLVARFRDEEFQAALEQIRHRPHHGWRDHREVRATGAGTVIGSGVAHQLARAGAGRPLPGHLSHLPLRGLPASMVRTRSEATFDTAPNQFVRHALEAWRGLAVDLMAGLESSTSLGAGPRGRGRREARWLRDRCDELLALPAMRAAGPFRGFGRSDQVLLRRPGYREVLRAFALADASLGLDLEVPHDVFSATRRNVATLYEYWCYLAIVDVIGRVAGAPPPGAAFRPSGDGLSLALEQGTGSKVAWTCEVDGRRLALELWFNRTFVPGEERSDATSWARRLRPDISLRVRPTRARPGQGRSGSPLDPALDVWLHFDAKYRIRALVVDDEVVGADDDEVPPAVHSGEAKREDLLKMHAYRDAIRRSAGAYVLYPGSGPGAVQQELHEILPGIGAFPLRPASGGRADGTEALARFIEDVLAHVADQSTARERAQYWSWEHQEPRESRVVPVEGAPRPPADLTVLVGYVREEQDDWVHGHALYNVRAGDRRGAIPLDSELLDADLVLLWTWGSDRRAGLRSIWRRTGPWTVVDGADLASLGYPAKELDHRYLVTGLSPLQQGSSWTVDRDRLVAASSSDGSPVLVRWIDLAARSV